MSIYFREISQKKAQIFADFYKVTISGQEIVGRIDALLKKRGEKRSALCQAVGINPGALTDWGRRRNSIPAADTALLIADYFKTSIRWLLTGTDEQNLSSEERDLLSKYRCLDPQGQYEIQALLDAKLKVVGGLGEKTG